MKPVRRFIQSIIIVLTLYAMAYRYRSPSLGRIPLGSSGRDAYPAMPAIRYRDFIEESGLGLRQGLGFWKLSGFWPILVAPT